MGDSIAFHYTPYLRRLLAGEYDVHTKEGDRDAAANLDRPAGANGGDSGRVLEYVRERAVLGDLAYDGLLLNCGLHDIKRDPRTGARLVELDSYKSNLAAIFAVLERTGIGQVVWIQSTPVPDERHNAGVSEFKRYDRDLLRFNEAAEATAGRYGIPVLDLYAFSRALGEHVYCDHVHFTEEARCLQAAYIAGFVKGLSCEARAAD
ncbi:SGNH/GDSL hydrolase family protein [Cohnella fermenti]|uniref:SGNH/GDSL hydrolase family protein n=1 Tax=Cohnella fermenti TaxID=2565925 RepID=UPI001454C8E4|nr:SGNH/GDSL hydrolase family protein [Cohnella fermenti]